MKTSNNDWQMLLTINQEALLIIPKTSSQLSHLATMTWTSAAKNLADFQIQIW